MADWSTGYQLAQQGFAQAARNRQARAALAQEAERQGSMLQLGQNRLEQDAAAQTSMDAYRRAMIDQATKNFDLAERQFDLDVNQQIFDQDRINRRMLQGPFGVGMPAPVGGFGSGGAQADGGGQPRAVPAGFDSDGKMSYKFVYGDGMTNIVERKSPTGHSLYFAQTVDPATGLPVEKMLTDEQATGIKDRSTTIANMKAAYRQLNDLERTVEQYGAFQYGGPFAKLVHSIDWLTGKVNDAQREGRALTPRDLRAIDPEEAAVILSSEPYKLAVEFAKIVDPGSVAREGEVAAAQRYMLKLGLFSSNDVALAGVRRMREEMLRRADEMNVYDDAFPGVPRPQDAPRTRVNPETGETEIWQD